MKKKLYFSAPGVYTPALVKNEIVFERSFDANPLYGVQVNSVEHAAKIATVIVTSLALAQQA